MKKRYKAEEIVAIIREAETELNKGASPEEVCRKLQISEATLFRWRQKYGGLSTSEARRLRELERENADLKHLLADAELAKRILKVALKGKA